MMPESDRVRHAIQRGMRLVSAALCGALLPVLMTSSAIATPPPSSTGDVWELALDEEFTGASLDPQRWEVRSGCSPFCAAADTVGIDSNALVLTNRTAQPADQAAGQWVGAHVASQSLFGDGYLEIVLQAPAAAGLSTSAFLAPAGPAEPQRWELYLGELFQPAAGPPGSWIVRQRGFDWTPPTATGLTPWIGGISTAASTAADYSATPVTLGLYRTAAGDIGWYLNDVLTAREALPWSIGADAELAIHLRLAAAAYASDPAGADGAAARIDAVRWYATRDLIALHEPFAYAAGSIAGQGTGAGFAGPWSVDVPAAATSTGDGVSLPYPVTSPALGNGSRLLLTDAAAERPLALAIKLSELNAYFFSALVRKPDGAAVRFELLDNAGNIRWRMGLDAQEQAIAGIVTDATGSTAVPVIDQPVLLVGMMASRSGNVDDELRVKVFGVQSAIPDRGLEIAAFDATRKQLSQVTLTRLRLVATGGPVEIDELRFGPTLAAVTSVRGEIGSCPAPPDFVDDDVLDERDAAAFLAHFDAQSAAADINGDGRADLRDYSDFTLAFSQGCP